MVVGWLAVTRLGRKKNKSSMRDSIHWYGGSFPDRGNSVLICQDGSGKQQILGLSSEA